jgi:hypothetical protein
MYSLPLSSVKVLIKGEIEKDYFAQLVEHWLEQSTNKKVSKFGTYFRSSNKEFDGLK